MDLIHVTKYNGVEQENLYITEDGKTRYDYDRYNLKNNISYMVFSEGDKVSYDIHLINEGKILDDVILDKNYVPDILNHSMKNNDYNKFHRIKTNKDICKVYGLIVEYNDKAEEDKKIIKSNTINLFLQTDGFNLLTYFMIALNALVSLAITNSNYLITKECVVDSSMLELNPMLFLGVFTFNTLIFFVLCNIANKETFTIKSISTYIFLVGIVLFGYKFGIQDGDLSFYVIIEIIMFINKGYSNIFKKFKRDYIN